MNSRFHNNGAGKGGGALSMRSAATGITVENVLFEENDSEMDGGALYIESAAGGVLFKNCTFNLNHAQMSGGAVALVVSNGRRGLVLLAESPIVFQDCALENNFANRGGAMFLDRDNEVELFDCVLRGNQASDSGGSIHADSDDLLTLTSTTLEGNRAVQYGGGLAIGTFNKIKLYSVSIVHNFAGNKCAFILCLFSSL